MVARLLVFPSPDGELVGLDPVQDFQIKTLIVEEFPSPDGELVGLDTIKKEQSK